VSFHEIFIIKKVSYNTFETHCECTSRAETSEIYGNRRISGGKLELHMKKILNQALSLQFVWL
jgi:hypothetical protein